MADVDISKFRAEVVRDGFRPSNPGFVVSEGQNPTDPAGSGQNHLPVTIAPVSTGLAITDAQVLFGAGTVGQYIRGDGSLATFPAVTGTVTSVGLTMPAAFSVANSPVTSAGTLAVTATGTTAQYIAGNGTLITFPALTGFVPYTGANQTVNLNTQQLQAGHTTLTTNGSTETLTVNHTSGSGIGINITKGGNNEGLRVNKTSGSGNAATIIGTLEATTLKKTGGTSAQFLKADGSIDSTAYGTGTVTSVGLSSATSGVTIGSTPVTTSGTITLAIATASGLQNGLLSSSDWTTFNNKQNALTNPVTGTGAAGQVAFWNGTTTQTGSNNLFWDNTNGRLGIGTIIPASRFQVDSAGYSLIAGSDTGNRRVYIGLESTGEPSIQGTLSNGTARQISINPSGGNVLIGTTTPNGNTLRVGGTGWFDSGVFATEGVFNNGINSSNGIKVISSLSSSLFTGGIEFLRTTVAGGSKVQPLRDAAIGGVGFDFLVTANNTAEINATYTSALKILNSGNLGLGVTPSAWQTDVKAIQIGDVGSNICANNAAYSGGNNVWINNNSFQNSSVQDIYTRTATAGQYNIQGNTHIWRTAPSGTAGNAISFTQAMTLDASGNLSVGTPSANRRLTVGGTSNAYMSFNATSNRNTTIGSDGFGNFIVFDDTAANYRMVIASSGNLLVGTTTDNGARLQVSGSATITGSTNQQLVLDYTTASGEFTWQSFRLNGTNRYRIFGNTDNSFTLYSDILSSNVLSITSSGNVGIGTATPGTLVQALNSTNNSATFSSRFNASGFFAQLEIRNFSSNLNIIEDAQFRIVHNFNDDTGNGYIGFHRGGGLNGGFLSFGTSGGERMRITSGGNVLIGTTTDVGARLHVNGNIRTAAPTGGSAVNWRLGNARGGTVTTNATVRVEIDGVLVDLVARYV